MNGRYSSIVFSVAYDLTKRITRDESDISSLLTEKHGRNCRFASFSTTVMPLSFLRAVRSSFLEKMVTGQYSERSEPKSTPIAPSPITAIFFSFPLTFSRLQPKPHCYNKNQTEMTRKAHKKWALLLIQESPFAYSDNAYSAYFMLISDSELTLKEFKIKLRIERISFKKLLHSSPCFFHDFLRGFRLIL